MKRLQNVVVLLFITAFSLVLSLYHLGSLRVPETYWEPKEPGETLIFDLGAAYPVGRISCFTGVMHNMVLKIDYSEDGSTWQQGPTLKPAWVFRWEYVDGTWQGRYFRVTFEKPGMLAEMAFFAEGNTVPLSIASVESFSASSGYEKLFDEQDKVSFERSYLNGTYFDEIYHARTAFEHLHRLPPYEWTHPPLGKVIIALGIALFGMNPFGWRIMGVVFGVLLLPLMFALGRLFLEDRYALFVTALFAFEFMRFVQARIATIDTYVVFFILLSSYFLFRYLLYAQEDRRGLLYLFLSGLFFGCGAATKWTAVYAGAGMAVLFLTHHFLRWKKDPTHLRHFERWVLPWSVFFFLVVPFVVYFLSYIPYLLVPGYGLSNVFRYQLAMYHYHRDLKATHPFSSPWWEWPVVARPIWLYKGDGLPSGYVSSIVSMGNPAIWWLGGITMLFSLFTPSFWRVKGVPWLLVGFFSQYVPWMLVPRITFIYHYYGCVPFLILLLGVFFAWVERDNSSLRVWRWIFLLVAMGFFVLFYPILSGETVSKAYVARFLRWFPSWTFFAGGE